MRVLLWDEAPDIDTQEPMRLCCDCCKRRTAYRYDAFDFPVCLEHAEEEVSEV